MDHLVAHLTTCFRDQYQATPAVFGMAPGRVEVLGNHTDYNEGYILSAAIDRAIALAGRPRNDTTARVYCARFHESVTFNVEKLEHDPQASWADYIKGTLHECRAAGLPVHGFDAVLFGDVPFGAGLSSSAALEVATAQMVMGLCGKTLSKREIALLCQRAENHFVGMPCGILDQWSSVHGEDNALIFLDCRELDGDNVPLGDGVELVLANTNAPHKLVDGAYAALRKACFEAVDVLKKHKTGITHLRDISVEEFEQWSSSLEPDIRRRARHIVTENDRVLRGVDALKHGRIAEMGQLMLASHASSRDDFGNSCKELDAMVDCASQIAGCHGSRLSGGGFGGCTVNLVDADKAAAFAEELAARYEAAVGIVPEMHRCRAIAGASVLHVD